MSDPEKLYREFCKSPDGDWSVRGIFKAGYKAALSNSELKAKLVVNMIKYLGATKTQAKEIVDGVFDGEETFKTEKGPL